ncbi:hypothetical protein Tco_1173238 [Tanacetum coccineum]
MMAYLKHVGNFKHSDLKTKKFEEIQALYEKIKRSDEDFISIGEMMEKKSVITRLSKVSSPDGDYLVIYRANGNFRENNTRRQLYEACGVYILELKDGTVIHMLVKRKYPLSKDLLQRILGLGLEVERESTAALDLIRFIKQQIDEK